ncbi:MAG: class I SAM-dependent methyltransferase [Sphingomonadaceae bacterium]
MRQTFFPLALALPVALGLAACAEVSQGTRTISMGEEIALTSAVNAPSRSEENRARDRYRNPIETLSFFEVRPDDVVVEIWPGGGWYTEILAPYLAGEGVLYTVASPRGLGTVTTLKQEDPATYGQVRTAAFLPWDEGERVPDGIADVVLTFRNVHNWRMGSGRDGEDYAAAAFAEAYRMLKPGGIFGVVDHRLPEDAPDEREKTSGYIKVSTVMELAEQAGFEFVAASEINANPADTADWEKGVWTLPPSLRLGEEDRERYLAIGESDRMTLKFRKPR